MGKLTLNSRNAVNIAKSAVVQAALSEQGEKVKRILQSNAEQHIKTGRTAASITLRTVPGRQGVPDRLVSVAHPGLLGFIEFETEHNSPDGPYVQPGIGIIAATLRELKG